MPLRSRPRPPRRAMDDSQFLGSMMGETVLAQPAPDPGLAAAPGPAPVPPQQQQQQLVVPSVAVGKKRGRPPRKKDGATAVVAAPTVAAAPPAATTRPRSRVPDERSSRNRRRIGDEQVRPVAGVLPPGVAPQLALPGGLRRNGDHHHQAHLRVHRGGHQQLQVRPGAEALIQEQYKKEWRTS